MGGVGAFSRAESGTVLSAFSHDDDVVLVVVSPVGWWVQTGGWLAGGLPIMGLTLGFSGALPQSFLYSRYPLK